MKSKRLTYLFILALLFLSCNKENEHIDLVAGYLFVSDVLEYCQGSCEVLYDWENSDVLVKGHVMNIQNDSIYNDYYNNSRIYLEDIRNGLFMEIRITDQLDDIFDILNQVQKQDEVYIKGKTSSISIIDDNSCKKGVYIELSESQHILINQ